MACSRVVIPAARRRVPAFWTVLAILIAFLGAVSAAVPLLTRFWFSVRPILFLRSRNLFQLLHLPVTHDLGRLVTLVYWVASSLLAAVFVYRVSKSTLLACAAGLCAMLTSRVLSSEPGHPQQVVLLLYMIAACLALPSRSGRNNLRFFLLGCVGAALVFTKLNVGVFYIAGLAQALVCLLPPGKIRSIGLGLTLTYAAAVPWVLMHGSSDRGFAGYFLLATVSGIVTFVCGAILRPDSRLPGAGLLAGTALIIGATWLQGMPVRALVSGVILNPMDHPNVLDSVPRQRTHLVGCHHPNHRGTRSEIIKTPFGGVAVARLREMRRGDWINFGVDPAVSNQTGRAFAPAVLDTRTALGTSAAGRPSGLSCPPRRSVTKRRSWYTRRNVCDSRQRHHH